MAEGINTIHLVKLKADELNVYMPLVSALNDILFNGRSIADASAALMGSDNNSDVEYRANLATTADVQHSAS